MKRHFSIHRSPFDGPNLFRLALKDRAFAADNALMSIAGNHIQAVTGRRLDFWATYAPVSSRAAEIVYVAQILEGGTTLDWLDGELVFDPLRIVAEEALRFQLKVYIDRTAFQAAPGSGRLFAQPQGQETGPK